MAHVRRAEHIALWTVARFAAGEQIAVEHPRARHPEPTSRNESASSSAGSAVAWAQPLSSELLLLVLVLVGIA
jgi:hypothetical protein